MQDSLHGVVKNILGKDILEIQILNTGKFNEHNYKDCACIRIAGVNDPELSSGIPNISKIEKLKNKEVHCIILAKDSDGNAIALVQCIN